MCAIPILANHRQPRTRCCMRFGGSYTRSRGAVGAGTSHDQHVSRGYQPNDNTAWSTHRTARSVGADLHSPKSLGRRPGGTQSRFNPRQPSHALMCVHHRRDAVSAGHNRKDDFFGLQEGRQSLDGM